MPSAAGLPICDCDPAGGTGGRRGGGLTDPLEKPDGLPLTRVIVSILSLELKPSPPRTQDSEGPGSVCQACAGIVWLETADSPYQTFRF